MALLPLFEKPAEELRSDIERDIQRLGRYAAGDITAGKHGGARASEEAHERIRESSAESRERIYRFIWRRGEYGATTDEIAEALGLFPNQVSGRVSELLYREKSVVRNGVQRKTRGGFTADVVVAVGGSGA